MIPFTAETVGRLYPLAFVSATQTPTGVAALLASLNLHAHGAHVVTQSQASSRLVCGLVPAQRDESVLGPSIPDGPSYHPLLREAIRVTGAWYPLAISQSLAFVAAARQIHVPSVLVLNESADLRSLLLIPQDERPTFVATDLRDLFRHQPIADCDAHYWECEGWIATVTHGRLRLYPGPPSTLGAGARVMCAAAWNFRGADLDIDSAVELFTSLAA
ncbi:hypothetical protein AOZ06_47160 [Kibdelosporangium phytohabitans]|uniref:Uncharacterized protein n=1 Tax=Kibdelosporangium phytohabitans TaxID=860235 RepID=A0A0N9I5R9_9PSEU|nr:hypothetical protein AOZ06_47160 [Kibdelosporangium phytohabitans]